MPSGPHHGKQEITDPVEEMLKKTGCITQHYKVQVGFLLSGIIRHLKINIDSRSA